MSLWRDRSTEKTPGKAAKTLPPKGAAGNRRWHWPCFASGRQIKIDLLLGEGLVPPIIPLLGLLLAAGPAPAASADDELRFGIEVARKGLWLEARFRFERAVLLDPDNASALNNLAIALEQQGEFQRARDAYEKALKLKPGHLYIQQNYDLFREADEKRNRKSKKKP